MENREQQILSEIKSMMSSIRTQLERLDAKMAELQQIVDPEDFAAESIDIEINMDEPVVPEVETVEIQDDDLPFGDIPEAAPEVEPVEEPAVEPEPEGEPVTVAAKAEGMAMPTINDVMAGNQAWRKDMPGTPVKDIRSAISLNDRVIFINLLFKEDAQAFVNALTRINSMETLDQVVEFINSEFADWDLDSDLVYRFMMAVRRKVK